MTVGFVLLALVAAIVIAAIFVRRPKRTYAQWDQPDAIPWPYEVACPVCKAGAGQGCLPGGFHQAHGARFESSPAACRARAE